MCARGTCGTTCVGKCRTSCKGTCSGGCSRRCGSVCSSSCKNGCTAQCKGGCKGDCQGGCGSGCTGGCGSGCTGRCSGCSGTCGGNCSGTSAGTSYGVFDWTEGHAPIKKETISILAEDWNRLVDLIANKYNKPEIAVEPVDSEGKPVKGSAKVVKNEVFTAAKYNMLANALGIANVSNDTTKDNSIITADVIDALRIHYND